MSISENNSSFKLAGDANLESLNEDSNSSSNLNHPTGVSSHHLAESLNSYTSSKRFKFKNIKDYDHSFDLSSIAGGNSEALGKIFYS